MNSSVFQAAVTRLDIDPDYRKQATVSDGQALSDRMSELERQRLACIANDQGLDITCTLHKSFRLDKILGRTPFCRILLGTDSMARELERFWQHRLPASFYYLQEAISFCDFLISRTESGLDVNYLREIAAFERAELRLQLADRNNPDSIEAVRFEHSSRKLLETLSRGVAPQRLAEEPHMLIGKRENEGVIQWHYMTLELWNAWVLPATKT